MCRKKAVCACSIHEKHRVSCQDRSTLHFNSPHTCLICSIAKVFCVVKTPFVVLEHIAQHFSCAIAQKRNRALLQFCFLCDRPKGDSTIAENHSSNGQKCILSIVRLNKDPDILSSAKHNFSASVLPFFSLHLTSLSPPSIQSHRLISGPTFKDLFIILKGVNVHWLVFQDISFFFAPLPFQALVVSLLCSFLMRLLEKLVFLLLLTLSWIPGEVKEILRFSALFWGEPREVSYPTTVTIQKMPLSSNKQGWKGSKWLWIFTKGLRWWIICMRLIGISCTTKNRNL